MTRWMKRGPHAVDEGPPLARAELDQLRALGRLPLDLPQAFRIGEAAGCVLELPPVEEHSDGWVTGYGILPPQGAEPLLWIKHAATDPYGRSIPAGTLCVLGALWRNRRRPDRVVHRLWCRDPDKGPHGATGPFDVYDDQIAGVASLEGQVPALTGWQLQYFEPPAAEPPKLAIAAELPRR